MSLRSIHSVEDHTCIAETADTHNHTSVHVSISVITAISPVNGILFDFNLVPFCNFILFPLCLMIISVLTTHAVFLNHIGEFPDKIFQVIN